MKHELTVVESARSSISHESLDTPRHPTSISGPAVLKAWDTVLPVIDDTEYRQSLPTRLMIVTGGATKMESG